MSMKIKENPDGTKELEGTPEELAEFERRRRGEVKEDKKDKKKLLLEGTEDFAEIIRKVVSEELDKRPHTTITIPQETKSPWDFPVLPQIHPSPIMPWVSPNITWGGGWTLGSGALGAGSVNPLELQN